MEISLVIEGKMPSLNELIAKTNHNKYGGNEFKQNIESDIKWQILKQIREKNIEHLLPLKNMADFEFTYIEENKKRDKDNIASSKKYLFDALVRVGVIQNDGWKWVGDFKETFVIGSKYRVIIKIKEREGETK